MKIIITEVQSDRMIDKLLKVGNIEYQIEYGQRTYETNNIIYDSVYVRFIINGEKDPFPFVFYYRVNGDNKILGLESYGKISNLNVLQFVPEKMVNDYFKEKTREHLQNYLNEINKF